MIKLKSTLILVFVILSFGGQSQSISYLGNEGVLIEYNGSKVLIDALFDEYNLKFDAPSENTMTKIMTQTKPYDGVDMVLVTHAHRDHFNGQIAADYIQANKSTRMIATPQAVDSMKIYLTDFDKVSDRITSFPWKKGWKTLSHGNITITSAYMLHAGKRNFKIQNQVFIVKIGDKQVIHLGDTQMEHNNFDNMRLEYEDFDAVVVPFWYLTNVYGAELVRKFMHTNKVVGIHFPSDANSQPLEKIKEQFPNAVNFTKVGMKTQF